MLFSIQPVPMFPMVMLNRLMTPSPNRIGSFRMEQMEIR